MTKNERKKINLRKALESGDFLAVRRAARHTPWWLKQLGNQMFPLATEFCSPGGDHDKVVWLLFKMFPKFNPNEPDEITKLTPLDLAIRHDNLEMVKLLCEDVKVDPNAKEEWGTALHYAAYLHRIDIVKYLCEEANVDPNPTNKYGQEPLHFAAKSEYVVTTDQGLQLKLEVVKYLCEEAKVDKEARDNEGQTPLDLAVEKGYHDVKEYLLEQIAEKAKGSQEELQQLQQANASLQAKLESAQNELRVLTECRICMNAQKSYICIPCRYLCVCEDCAIHVNGGTCPICRAKVEGVYKVFL